MPGSESSTVRPRANSEPICVLVLTINFIALDN